MIATPPFFPPWAQVRLVEARLGIQLYSEDELPMPLPPEAPAKAEGGGGGAPIGDPSRPNGDAAPAGPIVLPPSKKRRS